MLLNTHIQRLYLQGFLHGSVRTMQSGTEQFDPVSALCHAFELHETTQRGPSNGPLLRASGYPLA